MTPELLFLSTDQAAKQREQLAPFMARIAERSFGRLDVPGLLDAIDAGSLWVAEAKRSDVDAVLVCKPIHWRTGIRELEFVGIAGEEWKAWIDLEAPLASAARAKGFHIIGGGMRPGLAKALADRGWNTTHVYAEKVLSHA